MRPGPRHLLFVWLLTTATAGCTDRGLSLDPHEPADLATPDVPGSTLDLSVPTASMVDLATEDVAAFDLDQNDQSVPPPTFGLQYAPMVGVPKPAHGLASADVNEDGHADLITAGFLDNDELVVWLGVGDGTFTAGPIHAPAGHPYEVDAVEINGDAHQDLVVVSADWGCHVYEGAGDATFQLASSALSVGWPLQSPAYGDADADGDLEVLTSWPQLMRNDGTGGFDTVSLPTSFFAVSAVGMADLDGDGLSDVAIAGNNDKLFTFRSLPGGGLEPLGIHPVSYSRAIAGGDLDGDGKDELLVAGTNSDQVFLVPTRAPSIITTHPVGASPSALAVGDLDGDGRRDVVSVNRYSSSITVLLNDGSGGLRPGLTFAVGSTPHDVVLADLDEDGKLDVAVSAEGGGITILLNTTH